MRRGSHDESSGERDDGVRAFWNEVQLSMNRIARIYDKFVLGRDYLAEADTTRGKLEDQAKSPDEIAPPGQ